MPIEIDLKRQEREQKKRTSKGDKGPEEVENEQPPYSALTHIKIDDVQFVIKLCPGRHNPDVPRKSKMDRDADGKVIKPPKPCKNPACNLRAKMIDDMVTKTVEMKEKMLDVAANLENTQEERAEAEHELETQKQYLRDSEARYELLKQENKECEGELERIKQEEYDCKNKVTELEAERQRLARIVFENKLKQQGIELEGWDGDGLELNPSQVFTGAPGDFAGEPKDDFTDRSHYRPADWCRMEHLNLSEKAKVPRKSRLGVRHSHAMHRPKTSPPSVGRGSVTHNEWAAQAHILPQPSLASTVDDYTVRRFERTDRVKKPKTPSFNARALIEEERQENRMSRSAVLNTNSVSSWRTTTSLLSSRPGTSGHAVGVSGALLSPIRAGTAGASARGTRGKFGNSGVVRVDPARSQNLPHLR